MENMGPSPSRFDPEQPSLSPARARVLEAMQHNSASASAGEVALQLGVHENTARKHLDGLADRGLLERTQKPSAGRGRPASSYRALSQYAEPDVRVRDYVGLASALARHIAATSSDPRRDAIAAGEAWGAELSMEPRHDACTINATVMSLLDELGFAPEANGGSTSIALRRCPLLDAVRAAPEVVCAVHLGLARGAFTARGASAASVRLTPFAEVGACRLLLA